MSRLWTPIYSAITTSEKCAQLPDDTCRFFYVMLLLVVDSYGSIDAKPHVVHAKVWPLLGKPISETIRAVHECVRVGLVECYGDDGRRWVSVPDWDSKAGTQMRSKRGATPEFPSNSGVRRSASECVGPLRSASESALDRERESRERVERERVDSASAKPPPKKRKAKEAPGNPNHAPFVAWWCAEFEKATGQPYGFHGGRDGKNVTEILAQARESLDAAKAQALILLRRPPGWLADGGIDLGTLNRHWNVIGTAGQSKSNQTVNSLEGFQ